LKSPFYKFTGFEANIQPDRNDNEDFYAIKFHVESTEFILRDYAYKFIAEHVIDELRQYENPAAYVFVTVESPFPAWNDDILFARIWLDTNHEPCAELLASWEDL